MEENMPDYESLNHSTWECKRPSHGFQNIEEKTGKKMQEGLFSKLQKKFLCSKYNVQIKDWLKFYVKVMFTGEMKVVNN